MEKVLYCFYKIILKSARESKGLFTWREGAPANRATRLERLTHSPPLHATHLTETVSEMCGLSFERPLSITNKMAYRRIVLAASIFFLIAHSAKGLFSVYRTLVLYSTDSA